MVNDESWLYCQKVQYYYVFSLKFISIHVCHIILYRKLLLDADAILLPHYLIILLFSGLREIYVTFVCVCKYFLQEWILFDGAIDFCVRCFSIELNAVQLLSLALSLSSDRKIQKEGLVNNINVNMCKFSHCLNVVNNWFSQNCRQFIFSFHFISFIKSYIDYYNKSFCWKVKKVEKSSHVIDLLLIGNQHVHCCLFTNWMAINVNDDLLLVISMCIIS